MKISPHFLLAAFFIVNAPFCLQAIPSPGKGNFSLEEENLSFSEEEQVRYQQQLRDETADTADGKTSPTLVERDNQGTSSAADETFFSPYNAIDEARNNAIETHISSSSSAANAASVGNTSAVVIEEKSPGSSTGYMPLAQENDRVQLTSSDRVAVAIDEKPRSYENEEEYEPEDTSGIWKFILGEDFTQIRDPLIDYYNVREEIINRKMKSLEGLTQDLNGKRSTLLLLCEKAKAYHAACMHRLISNKVNSDKEGSKMGSASKLSIDLGFIEKLNDHPNQVEKIIIRVEAVFQKLEENQARLSEVDLQISNLQGNPNHPQRAYLIASRDNLRRLISGYKNDIKDEEDLAESIPLPFDIKATKNLAQYHSFLFEENNLEERPDATRFFQSAIRYYRAANAASNAGRDKQAGYLSSASRCCYEAAKEAARGKPNQREIEALLQEADENVKKSNSTSSCTIM